MIHKRRENVELKVATYIIKKFNAKKIYNVGKKKKLKKFNAKNVYNDGKKKKNFFYFNSKYLNKM